MRISNSRLTVLVREEIKKALDLYLILESPDAEYHVVLKGENPYGIAKKYKVAPSRLLKVNSINDPTKIQIGDKLLIPPPVEKLNSHLVPSQDLIDWMKYEEGEMDKDGKPQPHLESYDDGAGNLTIGYGRNQKSQRVQTIDKQFAEELLQIDLNDAAEAIKNSTVEDIPETITIPVQLTQNQFDALTSIAFNAGAGGYKSSKLHQEYISKGITSGADFEETFKNTMLKAGFSGLDNRRNRELLIFKDNVYKRKK